MLPQPKDDGNLSQTWFEWKLKWPAKCRECSKEISAGTLVLRCKTEGGNLFKHLACGASSKSLSATTNYVIGAADLCAQIPREIMNLGLKALSSNTTDIKHTFSVSELCGGCDLQFWYKRRGIPSDAPDLTIENEKNLLEWRSKTFVHDFLVRNYNIPGQLCLTEYPIAVSKCYTDIDTKLYITARFDNCFPNLETIVDTKVTKSLSWQSGQSFFEERIRSDEIPLQCYGTLYRAILPLSGLWLRYADLKLFDENFKGEPFKFYPVPLEDKSEWIESRASNLYMLTMEQTPPPYKPSRLCNYCKWRQRCQNENNWSFEEWRNKQESEDNGVCQPPV